jgi:hypothetical protein
MTLSGWRGVLCRAMRFRDGADEQRGLSPSGWSPSTTGTWSPSGPHSSQKTGPGRCGCALAARYPVNVTPTPLTLQLQAGAAPPIEVRVEQESAILHAGHSLHFDLETDALPVA